MAGPLASYNSLSDQYLAEYFSRPTNFNHLRKMGLITSDGKVVDERVVRMRAARKEHQQQAKELLAGAIVNKAVELERKRRADLKNKLELLAKYEIVERVKSQKRHPAGVQAFDPHHSESGSKPTSPLRLSASLERCQEQLGLSMGQIADLRQLARQTAPAKSPHPRARRPSSPYACGRSSEWSLPVSRTPSPRPLTPSVTTGDGSSTVHKKRSRVSRPNTAPPSGLRWSTSSHPVPSKAKVHSNVQLTLSYVGKGLQLVGCSGGDSEVLVSQQHCGGNTVTLYRKRLKPKDNFTFTSRRHLGMPFGLTIFVDGMIDCRVSSCCEYKHQPGRLLGSKSAHFRLVGVTGGRPCYQCEGGERQPKRQTKGAAPSVKESSLQVGGEQESPPHSEVLSRQPARHSTDSTGQAASPESHLSLSRRSKVDSKHKGSASSTASLGGHSPQSQASVADQTDSSEAVPEDLGGQLYEYGEDFEDEQEGKEEGGELLADPMTRQESVQTPDSLFEEKGSACVSSVEVSESENEDTSVLVQEASQIEPQRNQDAQAKSIEVEIKPDSVISIPPSLPPPPASSSEGGRGEAEPSSGTDLQTTAAHSGDLAYVKSRGDSELEVESIGSHKSSVSSSLTSLSSTTISSS